MISGHQNDARSDRRGAAVGAGVEADEVRADAAADAPNASSLLVIMRPQLPILAPEVGPLISDQVEHRGSVLRPQIGTEKLPPMAAATLHVVQLPLVKSGGVSQGFVVRSSA